MRRLKDKFLTSLSGPFGFELDPATRILGYHNVGDQSNSLTVSAENFRAHIECLLGLGFRILSMSQWYALCTERNRIPDKCVVLTFDDGYRSMLTEVAPILEEYGIEATVFVVSDAVGTTNGYDLSLGAPEMRMLDWGELAELRERGWDIQSHSRRHYAMSELSDEQIRDELTGSRAILEERLGVTVKFFCYPYGVFRKNTIELLKKTGYAAAVSCWAGTVSEWSGQDLYRLPRVMMDGIEEKEDVEFRFTRAYRRLSGFAQWMRKMRGLDLESYPDVHESALLKRVP